MGKLFLRFLKEKGVYEEYEEKATRFYTLPEVFTLNLPSLWLTGLFDWSATKQGPLFWCKLNSEWLHILGKLGANR